MFDVQLDEKEATILRHRLRLLLSDLRMEIADTERQDFRDGLKQEKATIEHVIEQLEQVV